MKIKFKKACELEVINSFDEDSQTVDSINESFAEGEIVEGDIFEEIETAVGFQFGDGSCVYSLPRDLFEVIA